MASLVRLYVVLFVCLGNLGVMGANLTNFVLVGSTGDLARKYLWEALFVGFVENSFGHDLRIYGAATRPVEQGAATIAGHIAALHCKDEWSVEQCSRGLAEFKEAVSYVQLKKEQDFQALQATLASPEETLRVVYLSVSPSLYSSLAASVDQHLRPERGAELRVVFEKPFGRDLGSAEQLSEQLASHLEEEEIFRVDHYLGKAGMRAIVEFRRANQALLAALRMPGLLSSATELAEGEGGGDKAGGRVSVLMKEQEHTAGRSGYYDQYGVIRDVFQNHLTQALVYSLMPLRPHCSSTFGLLADRLIVLRALEYSGAGSELSPAAEEADGTEAAAAEVVSACAGAGVCRAEWAKQQHPVGGIWLGQYDGYSRHLAEDHVEQATRGSKDVHIDPDELERVQASVTPTAAVVNFQFSPSSPSLEGNFRPVAATIAGGKALDAREMVIQITAGGSGGSVNESECSLLFGVQGRPSTHLSPSLAPSSSSSSGPFLIMRGACWERGPLPRVVLPSGWGVDMGHCSDGIRGRIEDTADDIVNTSVQECLSRPHHLLTPSGGSGGSDISLPPRTDKYRNNAYILVLRALLANDRSYFTTTEELHSQWALWQPVLSDAAGATHAGGGGSGISVHPYGRGSLMDL